MDLKGLGLLCLALLGPVGYSEAADYSVAPGDTQGSIAQKAKVPGAVVERANPDLDWTQLKAGSKIWIPEAYVVKPKDTLYSLARSWGVDVAAVGGLNALAPVPVLKVGQVLYIPRKPAAKSAGSPSSFWPVDRPPKSMGDKLKSVSFGTSGETFRSVASGSVLYIGEFRGVGRVLLVQTPSKVVFAYGNFETAAVEFGQTVAKGQVLGTSSSRSSQRLIFFAFKDLGPLDPFSVPR